MNLYEIKENYLEFLNKIESGEIEEEFIHDTLEAITDAFETKADNLACYIKNLNSEATAISEEAKKMSERANQKKGKAEKLTEYLQSMMQQAGIKKVETTRNAITMKLSPPSVRVGFMFEDWAKNNTESYFVRTKLTHEADKNAIKEAIKNGEIVPHCELVQSEKINIK